ncbi:hypothetical protein HanIR_Chr09g0430331 [Helianthus annuus]|nr:hypothetical protein HanIR_Chr09g0430331 [Helianthus annuus]
MILINGYINLIRVTYPNNHPRCFGYFYWHANACHNKRSEIFCSLNSTLLIKNS